MKAIYSKKSISSALRLALASSIALTASMASMHLHAETATSNLSVTASVGSSCSIGTSAVAFGAYDPLGAHASADLNGTGTVSVVCTNGTVAAVTLGQGANADVSSTDAAPVRRMASGSNLLSYSLFSDSGRTTAWGNTEATGVEVTGTGTSSNLTVYGTLPMGQNVPAGAYSDTVVATITF